MNQEQRHKQCLEYCEYAAEKLRKAGFVLNYTSMKSEACYYEHPARKGYCIRIAAHRFSGAENRALPCDIAKTLVSITFSPGCFSEAPKSWDAIDTIIYKAVGEYFVKDIPQRLLKREEAA